MSCGGKMQVGGNPLIDPALFRPPSINQVNPDEIPAYQEEPMQQQAPMNRIQEGIAKGIIEAPRADSPDEQLTAQQWYDNRNSSPTQKPMKNPDDLMRRIGIGIRGFRTAAGWVARAIEHGRQNQYDYQQQTALGLMNPMPVEDFQPQGRGVNYYAEQGGTNPYSTYMMKGGKLKVVVKDYNKWNNDAQFDFGSGDNDQGMMQQGGMPRFSMTSGLTSGVRTKYTLEGPQEVPYQKLNELPFEPLPYLMPQTKTNFSFTYPDAKGQQMTQYFPTIEEFQKKMETTPYISQQIAGDKSSASASGYTQPSLKKGGYEIDRMIVVRRLIPEWLLNLGRLGTGKYRNLKNYQQGGSFTPDEVKNWNSLVKWYQDNGYGGDQRLNQDAYAREVFAKANKATGLNMDYNSMVPRVQSFLTNDRQKALDAYGQGTMAIGLGDAWYSQNPKMTPAYNPQFMDVKDLATKMNKLSGVDSIAGPLTMNSFIPQVNMTPTNDSRLAKIKPVTSASSYRKGGIHIKPENKGKFTDYCGGKVTNECIQKGLDSPSATIRKRANFARNARKWNH